jgi:hypothetical protein
MKHPFRSAVFFVASLLTFSLTESSFGQVPAHDKVIDSSVTIQEAAHPSPSKEVHLQWPAHNRATKYAIGSPAFTAMKARLVSVFPLTILGIDTSAWEKDNRVIVVYFKLTNLTAKSVNGFVEPYIGDDPYSAASVSIENLQPHSDFAGSVTIKDPPAPCYDNVLQLTFFETHGVVVKEINGNSPRLGKKIKNVTEQSSDISRLNVRTISVDKDLDFVDDNLEHFLLERFRPYFKFSIQDGQEQYRPCDVFNYVRSCTIGGDYESLLGKTDNCPPLPGFDQSGLSNPDNLLTAGVPNKKPVDLWAQHERSIVHLQPSDAAKHGNDWNEILASRNVGLYGHVVPVVLNSVAGYQRGAIFPCPQTPGSKLYYKVEYWQFFGYNYAHQHIFSRDYADHEGDWATVQLLVDSSTLKVASVFHYAHGGETRFDIDPSMVPASIKDSSGLQVMEYSGVNAGQPSNQDMADDGDGFKTKNNRRVRFFRENGQTEDTHPVVYIENGSHEFWPTEGGVYGSTQVGTRYYAPDHNGSGQSYLTAAPPNLGELEHPLNETPEANVILRYSGLWGCYNVYNSNPPGPTLHSEWTYPFDSGIYKDIAASLEN